MHLSRSIRLHPATFHCVHCFPFKQAISLLLHTWHCCTSLPLPPTLTNHYSPSTFPSCAYLDLLSHVHHSPHTAHTCTHPHTPPSHLPHSVLQLPCANDTQYLNQNFLAIPLWYNELALALMILSGDTSRLEWFEIILLYFYN